jgi:hypothetical protein
MQCFTLSWSRLCWCMSPKKLLFCYHLPTRRRAGVKLGDAWYIANVSIIFMLHACFTPIALCFIYTSWHVFAFSRTKLLTWCHSASSYFLLFLCFRKFTQEIFSELNETKAKVPIYLRGRQSPKEKRSWTRRQPHHRVARATHGHATRWCGPLVHPLTLPFRL